jgi:hypothetical protein
MPQIFSGIDVELSDFVSLFPDTDLTLTTERLVELFASMDDKYVVAIGAELDTPSSKGEEFLMNYLNPAQRKEAGLFGLLCPQPSSSLLVKDC